MQRCVLNEVREEIARKATICLDQTTCIVHLYYFFIWIYFLVYHVLDLEKNLNRRSKKRCKYSTCRTKQTSSEFHIFDSRISSRYIRTNFPWQARFQWAILKAGIAEGGEGGKGGRGEGGEGENGRRGERGERGNRRIGGTGNLGERRISGNGKSWNGKSWNGKRRNFKRWNRKIRNL